MEQFITLLICLAGSFITVSGYSDGKVTPACDTMMPSHQGNGAQTTTSPYSITVSRKNFSPGDVITVTITASGSNSFKGFLLQARAVGGNWMTGTFTTSDSNAQLICGSQSNSAVSHRNSNAKTSITASWTAPEGAGPVQFTATVVQSFNTFWTGVQSDIIQALQISSTTCGSQKFCLTNPTNCNPNDSSCNFMSSAPAGDGYVFEISAATPGYVAIGFSDDTSMGNDDVYICTRNSSGNIMVQKAYNTATVAPTIRSNNSAGSIVSSYNNGVLQCTFISQTAISLQQRATSNPTYYVFLVNGPSNADGTIQVHTKTSISSSKVDLSSYSTSGAQSGLDPVVRGHGALMLIAWMTTGSIGMIMARYMKSAAAKPVLGKAVWFQAHFFLMILTVILTIIAFIMVFVSAGDWSGGAHPVLGCIVMILSFFQPIFAFFRPDPKSEKRFIFNWGHSINALVIKILAVAAIFLGLTIVDSSSNQWMPKVMGGFFAWEVLFYIILETNMRLNTKEANQDNKVYIEKGAFMIFLSGNLAFLIALLVGIGQS
ncbi:putative ferric-chelate reductase 1 [Dendropsophus ebraccatus]|uniref:putative ferric-chelate reductase 1 n=1 Tax=Dendropsophus ebraccatus TaxID=150705 RepID=UPI003831AAF3